jgi:hypothetical protein
MADLFYESFDYYNIADIAKKWTQLMHNSNGASAFVTGVHGGKALQITAGGIGNGFGDIATITLAPANNVCIVGTEFTVSQLAHLTGGNTWGTSQCGGCILAIAYLGAIQCYLRVNSDGTLSVINNTTILGTSSFALSAGTTYYLELKVTVHASAGTVDLVVNGLTNILSLTGKNTAQSGTNLWNAVQFGSLCDQGNNAATATYDDIYIFDSTTAINNSFLGAIRIDPFFPSAAGDETNWTPDSGSNWARVSENPFDGDTSYVAATTAATKDTYKTPTQPVVGSNIFALQINMMARKTDAGAAGLKSVIRIAGVDYLGVEQGVPSTYGNLRWIYNQNPATSTAWVDGDIGPTKAQFGPDKST